VSNLFAGLAAGGELPPFRFASLFTEADLLSLPALGILVATGLYAWGVARLTLRGDRWPAGRTVLFALGLFAIAAVTVSGVGAYDDTLLSLHMVQHMVLSMVAPICLALGAPITLALRALPAGPRHRLAAVLHSRAARLLTFPLVTYGLFVATPFVLYFSDLYRLTMREDWLHELVHAHFLITGCLFFWPLIGLDPVPGRVGYPLRALLMFLATPFHTVLGLTVMQSTSLVGGDWYPSLGLSWVNPYDDQRVAGGVLWAGGELISVLMLAALVVQWMRQSDREARRLDRALDRLEQARTSQLDGAAPDGAAPDGIPAAGDGQPVWQRPWWETPTTGRSTGAGYDR
jgi:putative membrane protein